MERHQRVLERVGAERANDVRRDEQQLVTDVDLAAPDVRLQVGRRQAPIAVRVRERRQPGAPVEVGLGRPDGADVQLVVPDHGEPHADRPRILPERAALAGMGESLVRDLDRLHEADPDPGRLVVVVLAADRVGDEAGRLAGARAGDARGHEEEEVALGPRLGADARLHVERGVGRICGALGVGDDTELHLDPVGHWVLCQVAVGRGLSHAISSRQPRRPNGLPSYAAAQRTVSAAGRPPAAAGRARRRARFGRPRPGRRRGAGAPGPRSARRPRRRASRPRP